MTKADYLVIVGVVLIATGLAFIWWPVSLLFLGASCLKLARAMAAPKKAD